MRGPPLRPRIAFLTLPVSSVTRVTPSSESFAEIGRRNSTGADVGERVLGFKSADFAPV